MPVTPKWKTIMPPFRTQRRIEFGDTDMAGIVHFANFFRFMEAAECDFLRARGLSVKMEWEGRPIGFPRVSASCDYVRPARFEDVLDVTVTIERIGEKSVSFAFEFSRAGELLARGKVTSVCCRIGKDHELQGIEIPASYRARLLSEPSTP
jgi:YbgC/YbaW family acyl-CoA thioester hydrolase